ncbi:ATP-dependent helicase [Solicola gregarius]|uniref:DNA 3'-5' helicase n=1 Tax=Solicola gregarius TaxID=2908642 RepID=A0AA46YKS9_9ACTN|nr:ATP-dependent DNA helicase [Solicola gregarius]UYM06105.1 ATP-dependent helicase [Solicola gregarius]
MPVQYVLQRPRSATEPPVLDAGQRAVAEHPGGPLLVLAGPGTGKTTTLIEAVVDRIERRGLRPDQALVLTFGRKAADDLRTRIAGRLRQQATAPYAATFHSFCYALIRRYQDPEAFLDPLRLLSAPEQDVRIRELVEGARADGRILWPESLRPALRTRGFASELQGFMAQARSLGLDPVDIAETGLRHDRADWRSAADFFGEYLDVFDAQNLVDYAELVHRALIIAHDPQHRDELRAEFPLVVVDEYQDTDPAQVALLKALAGDGRDIIAVGDPDQSIYGFRGSDVRAIFRFPDEFRTRDGDPAPTLALTSTRRFGRRIVDVSRAVIDRLGSFGAIDAEAFRAFRAPQPVDPAYGDGSVEAYAFASTTAEAERIALLLRRAHLDSGVDWSEMAVLVRTGAAIPRLQRALNAAGVPTEVAGDEVPLRTEPAVQPLLLGLRIIDDLARDVDPDPDDVATLLAGPLGGLDAGQLRRVSRELRRLDSEPDESGEVRRPRPSRELLAEALTRPAVFGQLGADGADRAYRLGRLIARATDARSSYASPEALLWMLWDASGWGDRLRADAEGGGDRAANAHRDLDAVCALFEAASRAEERYQRRGVTQFLAELEDQQIPAEPLGELGVRGSAVRLLTAHRSKGLEWRIVVVAGVQEGVWPDVRYRGSLLQTDRLAPDGVQEPPSLAQRLAEERRLFYVAVTRAMERLVVTAVQSPLDDGDQPSRFFTELHTEIAGPGRPESRGRPRRPLSLRGVVGELRRVAETTTHEDVRTEAVARLARLAAPADGDVALPSADPDRWWGVRDETRSEVPVRPPDRPVDMSGSSLDGLVTCPLRWFLSHEARGDTPGTTAQGFGTLVHALAAEVATGDLEADPDVLDAHLDEVWQRLDYMAPWVSSLERAQARRAIERFVNWHLAARGRTAVAAEHRFEVEVPIGGDSVRLRGSMDRVEVDDGGRVHVVDLKTGKNPVQPKAVAEHPQLGVYQIAVQHGAVDEVIDGPVEAGGAELVQLRVPAGSKEPDSPKVQPQAAPDDSPAFVARAQLSDAVARVRGETFPATPGTTCRFCQFRSSCPAQPDGRTILAQASVSDPQPWRDE